jgi:hypothetical protein
VLHSGAGPIAPMQEVRDEPRRARASGCDDCVTKAHRPMQLLRVISGYLGD